LRHKTFLVMNKLLLLFSFFILTNVSIAQNFKVIDEYEASIGYLNIQGDLGIRNHFKTTLGNSGGTGQAKVYINFNDPYDYTRSYLGKHLRYNLGFDMGYSILKPSDPNLTYGIKANAMSGQVYYFDLGANVEYHISNLREVNFFASSFLSNFDPYVGVGVYGVYYGVELESALGNFEKTPSILPTSYVGRIKNGDRFTEGIHLETGIRYRFSDELQFSVKNDWMFFLDDYFDGVSPDPKKVENLYNDWLSKTSVGIVIFIQ